MERSEVFEWHFILFAQVDDAHSDIFLPFSFGLKEEKVRFSLQEVTLEKILENHIKAGDHFYWEEDELVVNLAAESVKMLCIDLKGRFSWGLISDILKISKFRKVNLLGHALIFMLESDLECCDEALD